MCQRCELVVGTVVRVETVVSLSDVRNGRVAMEKAVLFYCTCTQLQWMIVEVHELGERTDRTVPSAGSATGALAQHPLRQIGHYVRLMFY